MRSSLNDIISKIFAAKIEQAKFVQINPNWMKDDLVIAVNSGLLAVSGGWGNV
jgi:hypothetical protein